MRHFNHPYVPHMPNKSVEHAGLTRVNPDGSVDPSFNLGGSGIGGEKSPTVESILSSNGGYIIGGNFYTYNGVSRGNIARINADGTLDSAFAAGTGFDGNVNGMVMQPDGKIVVVGNFDAFNNTITHGIARLNPDGTLDTSFNSGTGFDSTASRIIMQPDGKVVVSGFFNKYNGVSRVGIARINAYTPPAPTAQVPLNGCVTIPKTLPRTGTRQLLKAGCVTNAGQRVGVNVTAWARGDMHNVLLYCKVSPKKTTTTRDTGYRSRYCARGTLMVRTYGHHLNVKITWSAPTKTGYTSYMRTKNYKN